MQSPAEFEQFLDKESHGDARKRRGWLESKYLELKQSIDPIAEEVRQGYADLFRKYERDDFAEHVQSEPVDLKASLARCIKHLYKKHTLTDTHREAISKYFALYNDMNTGTGFFLNGGPEKLEAQRKSLGEMGLLRDVLPFLHGICFTPSPGEIALERPLKEIKTRCKERGIQTFKTDNGVGAIVETDRDGEMTGEAGRPTVKDYWDKKGRVCKTEFIGDRGAIGTDGITNIYEYDEQGRLSNAFQLIHPKGESPRMYRGSRYEYIPGRPDNEYTEHVTGIDGKETTETYEDIKKKRERK